MKQRMNLRRQAGISLTESILAMAVAAVAAVVAYAGYRTLTADVDVSDMNASMVELVGKTRQVFGSGGSFTNVTTQNLINAKVVPARFRTDDTPAIYDVFGNVVDVSGGAQTFSLLLNGVGDQCAFIATGIANLAHAMRIGASAEIATGGISGGVEVKPVGGNLDTAAMATNCAVADTLIAIQFR